MPSKRLIDLFAHFDEIMDSGTPRDWKRCEKANAKRHYPHLTEC